MKTSCWFAMTLAASAQVAVAFTIDHDFPAGNVIVDSIEGDTAKARQDMLDTKYSWFYWAFRVKGAKGKTVRFVFADKYGGGPVGVRGPVVPRMAARPSPIRSTERRRTSSRTPRARISRRAMPPRMFSPPRSRGAAEADGAVCHNRPRVQVANISY